MEELTKRLDQLYSLDVLVITAAATGQLACENVFGQHNSSLTIGSIDPLAVRSFQTSDAEQCIDLWAPGGSLGSSLRGAFADSSNASYRYATLYTHTHTDTKHMHMGVECGTYTLLPIGQ